jgi:hypothetical protein
MQVPCQILRALIVLYFLPTKGVILPLERQKSPGLWARLAGLTVPAHNP